MKYDMQTDTNIDMLSRDDSMNLGMGRLSVREDINASEFDGGDQNNSSSRGKKQRRGIGGKMDGKRGGK